jgi:small multidrug resistance family-3 protein
VTARSIALFVVAAVAEIGGAYLMWQAIKEGRGVLFALAGAVALAGYGAIAALQPDANFGRVLAAYGGVFIVGSLLWGVIFDDFRPDRYDLAGALACLVGIAVIMYAPR